MRVPLFHARFFFHYVRPPPRPHSSCASALTSSTRQDVESFRNMNGNQIVGMHARSFLMQIEWIAVFTMYFASKRSDSERRLRVTCSAVTLMFPRASASYRWAAHLFALLALPVVALNSRCLLPPSVSYCQVRALLLTLWFLNL
jgi:hypothetical protein